MEDKNFKEDKRPIGIFDSGLGGLSVLKYLLTSLPYENFIYLGDLAHLPYGNKSKDSIIKYSLGCSKFLKKKDVKAIIIACNTASSYAYNIIKKDSIIPVFDVISPCIKEILPMKNKVIAILGTEKTIQSNIYCNLIKSSNNSIQVYNIACPLFVPIVEEGLENTKIAESIINMYLNNIRSKCLDYLILGCTHYPVLLNDIKKYFNNSVEILHSGPILGKKLSQYFCSNNHNNNNIKYYVTDSPDRFIKYGNKFLNQKIEKVQLVKIR